MKIRGERAEGGQSKGLLAVILVLTILNSIGLLVVMGSLSSTKSLVQDINGGTSDKAQLSSIQLSIGSLSDKLNTPTTQPATTSSKMMTCTGTLSQSLSGSASQVGSFTNYYLSGSSPISLTCNSL